MHEKAGWKKQIKHEKAVLDGENKIKSADRWSKTRKSANNIIKKLVIGANNSKINL